MRPLHTLLISTTILSKLTDEGYWFCEDILDENKRIKTEVKQRLHYISSDLWNSIEEFFVLQKTKSALGLLQDEMKCLKIITFSQALDEVLGGGIFLGEIVEFCGAAGSGKTQLCFQICISVQLPLSLGGVEGEALFLDTDSSFTPIRIKDMTESCIKLLANNSELQELKLESYLNSLTVSSFLKGIHCISIQDNLQLLAVTTVIENFLNNNSKVKLVVIDSLTFPFLDPFISSSLLRTQQICRITKELKDISLKYKIAIIVTNQLTTKIIQQEVKLSPALGENYAHSISKIIILGNLRNTKYSAAVLKSSYLPELGCEFQISEDGVRDL